ncbi:Hypothetical predicted protein [Olea europaea subsp. europaea]|uniref:Leucine-rich repeat-containing N-terminal plant-type domain-containing protein n=1 Tax=Olea europaea subsp. europaea TaxID=158383 RepID=A0A8S0QI37_OLEEU|nr:Hypothetical predicted protein [Olea europaea subsp. europaea]
MGFAALLYILAVFLTLSSVSNACPPSDRAALLAFKADLYEPHLGIFNSWTGYDCCHNWYGVSCDPETHRVADINLRGESEDPIFEKAHRTGYMTGTISPEICKLTRLSSLTIADWKGISGTIPACIVSLPFLRILDLIGNRLTGEIPADIGRLSRLTVLNVADNQLSGTIPRNNPRKFWQIKNAESGFTQQQQIKWANPILDILHISSFRFRSLMLSRALLSNNRLNGPIPYSISYIYRLSDLDLSLNRLSGKIPDSLGKMAVLATLNLDGNQISGTIPPTLINSAISILNLSRNGLEGYIPDNFGSTSYFMLMDLSYNNLKGRIPKSISSANYIGHLDVSHNHLCGPIPAGSPFDHLEASSFTYNDCLCGKPLKPC